MTDTPRDKTQPPPADVDADFDADPARRIRSVIGAFLYVAFADTAFDHTEEARLLAGLMGKKPFSTFDSGLLEAEYNTLVGALRSDFTAAAALILEDIQRARHDPHHAEEIVRAARAAIVADARLEAQEEAALERLCVALGREAGSI
ncbi:MAG: hypothetical protein GC152_09740 [Alphaproteobacteria bacterium]|nr:hypothetical protein [Alphaproteobacteria bacterium]